MKYKEIVIENGNPLAIFFDRFQFAGRANESLQFVPWLADKKRKYSNYGLIYLCCRKMLNSRLDSLYTITLQVQFCAPKYWSPILQQVLPKFFSNTTIQYNTIPPYLVGYPVGKPAYIQAPPYISMVYFKSRFSQHNRHVGGKVDSFSCLPGVRFIFGRIPSEKLYKNNNP
jgi:hypothetical protein